MRVGKEDFAEMPCAAQLLIGARVGIWGSHGTETEGD